MSHSARSERTSEKPFEWSPDEGRARTTSPVRAGLPSRISGRAPAGRDAADEGGDRVRVQPPDGDVVEERQGLGARADDVVGAHRDEVDPDRVPSREGGRE